MVARHAMVLYLEAIALAEMRSQHAFSARMPRRRMPADTLARLGGVDAGAAEETVGYAIHRQTDQALHLYHGLMSHSAQAVLAEPFRREGAFTLGHLVR